MTCDRNPRLAAWKKLSNQSGQITEMLVKAVLQVCDVYPVNLADVDHHANGSKCKMTNNTDKTKLIIKQQLSSRPKMSSTHVEMCASFLKVCSNGAALRLFFCEEKSLIRNFCLLLHSQEWHEGNSWLVTLSLALRAMRAPPNLHSRGLCASGCYFIYFGSGILGLVTSKLSWSVQL